MFRMNFFIIIGLSQGSLRAKILAIDQVSHRDLYLCVCMCVYMCVCVSTGTHTHTRTLLKVAIFIKFLFKIYTHVGFIKIKTVSKDTVFPKKNL